MRFCEANHGSVTAASEHVMYSTHSGKPEFLDTPFHHRSKSFKVNKTGFVDTGAINNNVEPFTIADRSLGPGVVQYVCIHTGMVGGRR